MKAVDKFFAGNCLWITDENPRRFSTSFFPAAAAFYAVFHNQHRLLLLLLNNILPILLEGALRSRRTKNEIHLRKASASIRGQRRVPCGQRPQLHPGPGRPAGTGRRQRAHNRLRPAQGHLPEHRGRGLRARQRRHHDRQAARRDDARPPRRHGHRGSGRQRQDHRQVRHERVLLYEPAREQLYRAARDRLRQRHHAQAERALGDNRPDHIRSLHQ